MGVERDIKISGCQSALRQNAIEDSSLLASRILVVEPNEDSAILISSFLELAGYTGVEIASSYKAALQRHAYQAFDLILIYTDLGEAEGLGAIQSLQALEPAFLPVIVMVSEFDQQVCQTFLRAGVREFVTKPLDGTALRLRVRNMLDMKRLARLNQSSLAVS